MHRAILCLLLMVGAISTAGAAEPTLPTVSSPPPVHGDAQFVGNVLFLTRARIYFVPETRSATRVVDGREETYQYTAYAQQNRPEDYTLAADDYRIYTVDGLLLDAAAVAERLRFSTPVLVADSAKKVDPLFLQQYKPGTLIIYLRPGLPRPEPPPAIPAPQPAVAPPAPGTPA